MPKASWKIVVILCLCGCRHAPDAAQPTPSAVTARYLVTTLDNVRGARVRVCSEGAPIRELVPIRAIVGTS